MCLDKKCSCTTQCRCIKCSVYDQKQTSHDEKSCRGQSCNDHAKKADKQQQSSDKK